MITKPSQVIAWDEVHVGTRSMFEAAGMRGVIEPSVRRVVMRIDFQGRRRGPRHQPVR